VGTKIAKGSIIAITTTNDAGATKTSPDQDGGARQS
jgi:hypothetical protein